MQKSLFGDFRQRSAKEKSRKNNTEMDFLNLSGFHNTAVGVWINNSLCFAAHSTVNSLKLLGSQENNQKRAHACVRCPKHHPDPESLEVERLRPECCSKLGFLASPRGKSVRRLSQGEKCLGFPGCVAVFVPSGSITHHYSRPVAKHRLRC